MVVNFRLVARLLGPALLWFGISALIPAAYSLFSHMRAFMPFVLCASTALGRGFFFNKIGKKISAVPSIRELFVFTVVLWACTVLTAALPFMLTLKDFSFAKALFESASALSTTGATVIDNLDLNPRPILLWRSMLQFIGG
ncbi:MAG TPA: hypothetical protein DCL74_00250, partial [Succinivibrionaceae bacterium]|nr:hypothetical protein [Succinivibrionaceae bacterium]